MQINKERKIIEAIEERGPMTTGQINDYLNEHLKWGSGGMNSVANILKKIKCIEKSGFHEKQINLGRCRQVIWSLKGDQQ